MNTQLGKVVERRYMGQGWRKYWTPAVIVIMIALFTNVSFAADQGHATPSASTWRVALDGTGDFFSIQEALDQAKSGDTVWIKAGTYAEDVTVHSKENLRLEGEDMDKVLITGLERVGTLHVGKWPYGAKNIEISNMTIEQHGGLGVGVFNGEGIVLRRIRVNGMVFGQQVQGLTIVDCRIGGSETTGIAFADSVATVRGSAIYDNDHGVAIGGTSRVRLERNVITRSLFDAVLISDTSQAIVIQNTLVGNNVGVRIQDAAIAQIRGNIIGESREAGVAFVSRENVAYSHNGLYHIKAPYLSPGSNGSTMVLPMDPTDIKNLPRFVDSAHDDYRLRSDSPFLGIGMFPYLGALPPLKSPG